MLSDSPPVGGELRWLPLGQEAPESTDMRDRAGLPLALHGNKRKKCLFPSAESQGCATVDVTFEL